MLTVKAGLYALGLLALTSSSLAAPAPADGKGDGDIQYLPSRFNIKRDESSGPLFAEEGPTFGDVLLQRDLKQVEGATKGTWFDAPLAAYAVGRKDQVKNHFALGDHKSTDSLSEIEVNFETVNGRKTQMVSRTDVGAKDQDIWWAGAIRNAAANIKDIGVDGLSGDGKLKEGTPDQALRLLTGRDAAITKELNVEDQLEYARQFAKSPVVFGFANSDDDQEVAEWRPVVGVTEEEGKKPTVSFYQLSSGKTPDLILDDAGVNVRAIAHLEDVLD
ncbi:hypothetical protein IAU59_002588 [Kwoniella sp. CBS 9459]